MLELLPPPLVDRAFSVREALDHGVTRSRLRRSDLDAPFHGVRTKPGATSHFERCRALASVLETDQFISHSSSAQLWRLPLPRPLEAEGLPIHVTSIIRRESRRSGVIGHRFPGAPPPTSLHGIPVSSPVEAWVECRDLLDVDDLIVLGDALVAKWSTFAAGSQLDLATLFDAARAAHAGGRRDCIGPGADSVRLAISRRNAIALLLVRNGLPEQN